MIRPVPKPKPRKKPLRPGQHRRTWMRAKRPRRLDGPGSDPARLDWVRTQQCALGVTLFSARQHCAGRTEACHEGRKPGMAMKCSDAETIPLCQAHHRQWTDHTGHFAGWSKEARRTWADHHIAETTARYLSAGSRRST